MAVSNIPRVGTRLAALALVGLLGCGDGTGPGTDRFGQLGSIQVRVTTPIGRDELNTNPTGEIEQVIDWSAEGPWKLTERIFYQDRFGDLNERPGTVDLDVSAFRYAQVISQINQVAGLRLFAPDPDLLPDGLPQGLRPECGDDSTVEFSVTDGRSGAVARWIRCGKGSLERLEPFGAGPDGGAGRVIQAVAFVRQLTVGNGFTSSFSGSLPFSTLARGDVTPLVISSPVLILNEDEWTGLWSAHAGQDSPAPLVDFETDFVIVAGIGDRFEAGTAVEVRRILTFGGGSVTEVVEMAPGDFCSPAARVVRPFHFVRVPRTALPMSFVTLPLQRVPCG